MSKLRIRRVPTIRMEKGWAGFSAPDTWWRDVVRWIDGVIESRVVHQTRDSEDEWPSVIVSPDAIVFFDLEEKIRLSFDRRNWPRMKERLNAVLERP